MQYKLVIRLSFKLLIDSVQHTIYKVSINGSLVKMLISRIFLAVRNLVKICGYFFIRNDF